MSETAQSVMMLARELANGGALHEINIPSPWRWSLGLQVLLVEDDEADAYLIRRALAKNSRVAEVLLAEDGVEALEMLDRRRVVPDLAIVDLHMPRKDGIGLLKDLAARGTTWFPSVVFTSSRASRDAHRATKHGAVGFMSKPKTEEGLAEALDRVIRNVL
jgi:CheY-like chemotaxis protein